MSAPPRACPACGGQLAPWRRAPAAEPAIEGTFALHRCARCGTAVTEGAAPPERDLHEEGAYRPGAPRLARLAAPVLGAFDAQRLALLRSAVPPPARLLDAGAGKGRFVAAARRAGYEATGLEPTRRGVEQSPVPLIRAGIEDAELPAASFDAVTLWHVLEHLEDPGAALDRLGAWVAPGGTLMVGVPNLASLQARIGGARWFHLDLPRHRTHFTVRGLHALLRTHGLEPVRTVHLLAEHNPYGMWQSLLNRATRTPSYLYNLLKRNAPLEPRDLAVTLAGLGLLPLAVALELLAGLARRGGTVAVLARRAAS